MSQDTEKKGPPVPVMMSEEVDIAQLRNRSELSDMTPRDVVPADHLDLNASQHGRRSFYNNGQALISSPTSPDVDGNRAVEAVQTFSSFLPRILEEKLQKLETADLSDGPPVCASVLDGAVIFLDASGFTALGERLKRECEETAAFELSSMLNRFFTVIIDTISTYGGDVIKFSGDALTVVWFVQDRYAPNLPEATLMAARCSEAIHRAVEEMEGNPGLSLHIGLGAGRLTCVEVGGAYKRMEYVLAGAPMGQISIAEPLAVGWETVISPEAYCLIAESGVKATKVDELPPEYYATMLTKSDEPEKQEEERRVRFEEHRAEHSAGYRLMENGQWPDFDAQSVLDSWWMMGSDAATDIADRHHVTTSPTIGGNHEARLFNAQHFMKYYIPGAVVKRLIDGQDGHLAEMLNISVIFMSVTGIDLAAVDEDDVDRVKRLGQILMLRVQESVYAWEGSINKLSFDDKGLLLVAGLGLPPFYHGDDPMRAVNCAFDLLDNIKRVAPNAEAKIGVSTGRTFCGVVGSKTRREYTVLGTMVNLSARLMQASEWGRIMVDAETHRATKTLFTYDEPMTVPMKGMGLVEMFSPSCRLGKNKKKKKLGRINYDEELAAAEWGRTNELCTLHAMLRSAKAKRFGVILLTGSRGSGKNYLVNEFPDMARSVGMNSFMAGKDSDTTNLTMSHESYLMFRKLFRDNVSPDYEYKPQRNWAMYAAWHTIVVECVSEGAKRSGKGRQEWMEDALASYKNGHFRQYGDFLESIIPTLKVGDPKRQSGGSFSRMTSAYEDTVAGMPTPVHIVGELIFGLLASFAEQFGPTLVTLHLQRGTSIINAMDENWSLVRKFGKERCGLVVAACTRSFKSSDLQQANGGIQHELIQMARANNSILVLEKLSMADRAKLAADLLCSEKLQPDLPKNRAPYKIRVSDLPRALIVALSDVACGNPKSTIEYLDPLMIGYSDSSEHAVVAGEEDAGAFLKDPPVKIRGDHDCRLISKYTDLSKYPAPKKIVGYLEQEYESLDVGLQYLLKVASVLTDDTGQHTNHISTAFTQEMIRPMLTQERRKRHLTSELEQLCDRGCLVAFSANDLRDQHPTMARKIQAWQGYFDRAYVFESRILQRLIQGRIVSKELTEIRKTKIRAKAKCRWLHVKNHVANLAKNRVFLRDHDYIVLNRHKLITIYAPSRRPAAPQKNGASAAPAPAKPKDTPLPSQSPDSSLVNAWSSGLLIFLLGVMVGRLPTLTSAIARVFGFS